MGSDTSPTEVLDYNEQPRQHEAPGCIGRARARPHERSKPCLSPRAWRRVSGRSRLKRLGREAPANPQDRGYQGVTRSAELWSVLAGPTSRSRYVCDSVRASTKR